MRVSHFVSILNKNMSLGKKITPADEYFVSLMTEGHIKPMEAYLMAFPHYKERKDSTNNTELCYYLKSPKISEMLEEYKAQVREKSVMSVEFMLEKLREFVTDESVRTNDKIKSMELAGKLQGLYTQKVQHSGGVEVSHNITPEMAAAVDELLR
jgi:hypothetical protein